MWRVYVISSIDHDYVYTGMTGDVERRLKEHNYGKSQTTRKYKPFMLLYKEKV